METLDPGLCWLVIVNIDIYKLGDLGILVLYSVCGPRFPSMGDAPTRDTGDDLVIRVEHCFNIFLLMNIKYIISKSKSWFLGLLLLRSELSKKVCSFKEKHQINNSTTGHSCGKNREAIGECRVRGALGPPLLFSLWRLSPVSNLVPSTGALQLHWRLTARILAAWGRGTGSAAHSTLPLCGLHPCPSTSWWFIPLVISLPVSSLLLYGIMAGASYLTCWIPASSFAKWE